MVNSNDSTDENAPINGNNALTKSDNAPMNSNNTSTKSVNSSMNYSASNDPNKI